MTEDYLTDDEQVEHVKRVVAENWAWVLGGIVLGAALIVGYRYYDNHRNEVALRAAAQFDAMGAALRQNDEGKARQIADGLIKDFPASPYADQAQLVLARMAVETGKPADAAAPLTQIMTNSKDTELRHIARLRLARLLIDQGKPDEAIKTLAEDTWGSFAADAHEVRGDAFYSKKDSKGAIAEYQAALNGDLSSGNASLIQLKLADLGSNPAPAPAMTLAVSPAAAPPATVKSSPVDSSNKAKP
jgi:predicted negative regulator of RcsB-dependent stress response